MKPLISVIIPVYNGERHISIAIQSALNQTFRPIEIIVVDDGSTDHSKEAVSAFEDVAYYYQENRKAGPARNFGISKSKGEYISFLDADDVWKADKLEKQLSYLQANPKHGFTICHLKPELIEDDIWPEHLNEEIYRTNPPGYFPSALLMPRSTFELVGDFTDQIGEDTDWFMRANDMGITHGVTPEVLVTKGIRHGSAMNAATTARSTMLKLVRASLQRRMENEEE